MELYINLLLHFFTKPNVIEASFDKIDLVGLLSALSFRKTVTNNLHKVDAERR